VGSHQIEDAALCHCTGCAHPGHKLRTDRYATETERKGMRDTGGGGEMAKKENGGGEQELRATCAQACCSFHGV